MMFNAMNKTCKTESLALVDSIGLSICFMVQIMSLPTLNYGVRKMQGLKCLFITVTKGAVGRHIASKAD
jgi:hypothetical protein